MKVNITLKRTTWHLLEELDISEADIEMLENGDLSPIYENDDAVYTIFCECPEDSEDEILEMDIIK